ncbi:hypothetical protein [Rhizobium bangladeshense]|uniref:hypothetical protein n=1 Tax=Rhizobium bangladeshense TaxID=1138189 RepID=UPI001C9095FB|nr:hypothetical protein [Rhizobium bangladeshense]MBY3614997.1 hypothetical protein [Rhizobium bangladeshense]
MATKYRSAARQLQVSARGMTQILNITRNDDGQYEITDQDGKIVYLAEKARGK